MDDINTAPEPTNEPPGPPTPVVESSKTKGTEASTAAAEPQSGAGEPSEGSRQNHKPDKFEHEVTERKISLGAIISGESTTIASVVNQYAAASTEVMFSSQLASRLNDGTERELRTVVTLEPGFSERVIATLEKRRVILLNGPAQCGKGTVAKYLASETAARQNLVNETFVVGPLESRIRVLPRQLATEETFRSRVTIFEDVFEYGNRDLLAFFRSDSAAWEELRASLTANNAFFIFTSSQAQMEALRDRLRVSCFEVTPAPELVGTAIDRKLEWLDAEAGWLKEKVEDLRRQRDLILLKLQTIPRVASMIDDYVGGDEELDTVLDRHASASPSLLDDLQTDVDAWCFAVTLAIADTGDEPLAWSAFDRLRRLVTTHIKNDRELLPPTLGGRRYPPATAQSRRSASRCLSDKPLLTRCGATFRKDPSGLYDVPRFIDPACGRRIWKSLLDHHRRVLLTLAPLLRAIASNAVPELPPSVRIVAAHALGRIGTMDPLAITVSLIDSQQTASPDNPLRPMIGPLVRGAVAARAERYRRKVLDALDELTNVDSESFDRQAIHRVRTAIDAYSHLGNDTSAKPIIRFREIAARHCVPPLLSAYAHFKQLEASHRDRSRTRSKRASDEEELYLRANAQLAKCGIIALPLQRAIARLCHDDVQVLVALRDWISAGSAEMRVFVPFLFLAQDGLIDALESLAVDIEGGDESTRINAVIFAAAASRQQQNDLAALLCDIYGAIGNNPLVPDAIQEELEQRFAGCLVRWATSAAAAPRFRHGFEELFVTLAAARGGLLRRWLFALLRRPEFAETEGVKAFASSVRRQMDL